MSKQIDLASAPASKSELDLFSVPPTQVAVQAGYWCGYRLNNPITNTGPYRFIIPRENYMLDLAKNYLYLRLKIVNGDGANLTTEVVGPINLLGKSFIERCIIKMGDREVYNSGGLYTYQSYIETVLNYGKHSKENELQNALFYKDIAGKFDDLVQNNGFVKRSRLTGNSKEIELMAPIHCELFMQDRYLINQCSLEVTLHRNSDKFCLMSSEASPTFKIDVLDMRFYVYKVKVQDSLAMSIDRMLLEKRISAKYPIRRARLVNRRILKNTVSATESYIFHGQLPRRIIFGLVASKAFNGDYTSNPFNFGHFNVVEASIWVGDRQVPREPLRMNFGGDQFALPYMYLIEGCGLAREDKGNDVTVDDFKGGNAFFVFELTPDNLDSISMQLIEEGTVRIHLTFGSPINLDEGVELVVYGEFDNIITIDYNRTVFTDF